MPIFYKIGDLLGCTEKVIAHGVNCQGVMGSGIAKSIKEKYPEVFERYHNTHKIRDLVLGEIIPVETKDNKIVVNMMTQEYFGRDGLRYVSYDAVSAACQNLRKYLEQEKITEIAIPMIGAGLGGGSWNVIAEIFNSELPSITINVYQLKDVK